MASSTWYKTTKILAELEALARYKLEKLTDTRITITQAYVLEALYQQDGQRPMDLARAVVREATSFTPVLDGLEALNLIKRIPSKDDRRSICIHLTPKGRSLALVVVQELAAVEAEYSDAAS